MYKNNNREIIKFKGCNPIQLSLNSTEIEPAIGCRFYTNC